MIDNMRILQLNAENFKRLHVVEIRPDSAMVQITGANGSGKSSVLDALYVALAGKKAADPVPVRVGEESATISLDLGKIKVTRRFDADGTTSVVVEAEDGARYGSPQTMLDKLAGSLSFDPLEFTRMDAKGKSAALRKVVNLTIDVDALTRENQVDFQARTGVNRQIKELAPRVKALKDSIPSEVPPVVDVAALIEKMRGATEHNGAIETERRRRADEGEGLDGLAAEVRQIDKEIALLQTRRARALELALNIRRAVDAREPLDAPIDVAALADKIQAAQAANRQAEAAARSAEQWEKLETDLRDLAEQAGNLTHDIEARKAAIQSELALTEMPVPGLSFSDTFDVLYNTLPFEQASSAEQLRVSVAIAMAMNPKLKVLRVKDGSLLDETSLAILAEMVELAGYQCWIERVETSGAVGIVMENGAVKEAVPA